MLFFRTSMHDASRRRWHLMSCRMRCHVLAPSACSPPGSWPLIKTHPSH
jgi:hypothetical protein